MNSLGKAATILLVEDSPADQTLVKRGLEKSSIPPTLHIVEHGEAALEYLRRQGAYQDPTKSPRPDIILLDINMPRMNGKQLLKEIRKDPNLRTIPVVILTTSQADQDIQEAYTLGVNAYITKPDDVSDYLSMVRSLDRFWLHTVVLPSRIAAE
jgi:CheY-like chemotaxis protein